MDRVRHPVGYIHRADRILENATVDGMECFGIVLSAKKYGTNPDGMLHRMWFDVQTRLPVRMEFEFPRGEGKPVARLVRDRFEWDPELPPDTFVPVIPDGFAEAR